MKSFLILLLFLLINFFSFAQPDHIKRLMEKMQTGKELTEAEEQEMVKWAESMDKEPDPTKKPTSSNPKQKALAGPSGMCPKVLPAKPTITPLTAETYISLAKSLMATYGSKMGVEIASLDKLLGSGKPTLGADLGAMYSMIGAGSATIYSTAWSAVKIPTDVLTANNLGVALKGMGEYTKAIQVLLYANKLKPNVPLISTNLGWAYREMGDPINARLMFERALQLAPELPSPQLGLGLLAECDGNHTKALQYLRKALAGRYSAVGIAAYKQAKAAQSNSKSGNQNQSVANEKGETKEFDIPELPVFENKGKMEQAEAPLNDYSSKLTGQISDLMAQFLSLSKIVQQQNANAKQNPGNSVVFARDFSKELFMLEDISDLLWGKGSNWKKIVDEAARLNEKVSTEVMEGLPERMQITEKMLKIGEDEKPIVDQYMKDDAACGGESSCVNRVLAKYKADMAPFEAEFEQLELRLCKLDKGELDVKISNKYKAWKLLSDELKTTGRDYYAFSNPILEKIYAPSYNEMLNVFRELTILNMQNAVLKMAMDLPEEAKEFNELKCVDREPTQAASTVKDPKLPKKEKAPCPLGEQGFDFGLGGISFKLNCERAEISGGEGFLWSAKRDFGKHQTIVWGALGAKAEYGHGNLTGEASVGVEVTIGQGAVQDVALTSSVKAGLGGLVEGEVSGRLSLEDGASIEGTGEFTPPGIEDLIIPTNSDK